ncbi:MAG: TraB/GumN family protein [Acidobacteriota bacterium]|nr:TraB/GumN family protein [Acidobacteriota bacterium]
MAGLWLVLTAAAAAFAQPAAEPTDGGLGESLDVVGHGPGPALWRVTGEASTLWIIGVPAVVPADLSLSLDSIESAVAVSQRYLAVPELVSKVANPLAAIGTLRKVKRLERNAGGKKLKDVLSRDRYFLFGRIRGRYAPRDSFEKLRPYAAAEELFELAVAAEGLSKPVAVLAAIRRAARKASLESVRTSVEVLPKDLLAALGSISAEQDLRCFDDTLSQLDSQLDQFRNRAEAWARGEAVPASDSADPRLPCGSSAEAFRGFIAVRDQAWLQAAETALRGTGSSVAALPMSEIERPEGLLGQLATQGYEVHRPH